MIGFPGTSMPVPVAQASGGELAALHPVVSVGLSRAYRRLAGDRVDGFAFGGRLIRPTLALAVARSEGHETDERFWLGALAVQLVHEASLVHDDIVDGGDTRRGEASHVARHGVSAALLYGDHLLTAGYRAVALTGHPGLIERFTGAVERTVAAERALTAAAGRPLPSDEYRALVRGKTGELVGYALAVGPELAHTGRADDYAELGRRAGLIYQMADDLLDYCPRAAGQKTRLGDYAARRWSWVLEAADLEFGRDPATVHRHLFRPGPGPSRARRLLSVLADECRSFRVHAAGLSGGVWLRAMVDGWWSRARAAVAVEEACHDGA